MVKQPRITGSIVMMSSKKPLQKPKPGFCATPEKQAYFSEATALFAALNTTRVHKTSGTEKIPRLHAYYDSMCGYWHLTSKASLNKMWWWTPEDGWVSTSPLVTAAAKEAARAKAEAKEKSKTMVHVRFRKASPGTMKPWIMECPCCGKNSSYTNMDAAMTASRAHATRMHSPDSTTQ
jgi:hypothetical protein